MSQCCTYLMEDNSYGILACSLPDDDVALIVEADLLQRWGYPKDFIRIVGETKLACKRSKTIERKPQFADLQSKSKDIITCAQATEENDLTAQATEENDLTAHATEENDLTAHATEVNDLPASDSDLSAHATEVNDLPAHATEVNDLPASNSDLPAHATEKSDLPDFESDLPARVRELYQQAEACYNSGQTLDSLTYIDEALGTDDVHDNNLLLTLKVKILNSTGNYVESLKSAAKVRVENRSKELLVEGATALDKLNLLFTAEEWLKAAILDRTKEAEGLPWTQKAIQLFHSVRNKRIYQPLTKQLPVTVSVSERGRGVYAKRMIAKGMIFSELPDLLEQSLTSKVTVCAHCGMSLVKPEDALIQGKLMTSELKKALKKCWQKRTTTLCQICKRVVYCSELCRNDAWLSYHKVICPSSLNSAAAVLYDVRDSFQDVKVENGISWQGWWNAEFSPVLMARMWATILTQAKARAGDRISPTMADLLPVLSQFEKYSSASETQASTYVPKTCELMKNIFKRSKVLRYQITDAEFNKKYNKISVNYISFHDVNNPVQEFLDKIKTEAKLYKKIGSYFKDPPPKADIHGLFPVASCINHSCLPNAEIQSGLVDGKPGIIVVATRDINPLEEILISYVSPSLGRNERRNSLMRRYKFWCQCLRCTFEGDGPDKCTQCGKWTQCTFDSMMGEPGRAEMDSLQAAVDVHDRNSMQRFSERFESARLIETPRDSPRFIETSDCQPKCLRDSQGDVQNNADLKNKSTMSDLNYEDVSEGVNCCGVASHSHVVDSNKKHNETFASISRKSPERTNRREVEIKPRSDNEKPLLKLCDRDIDKVNSKSDSELKSWTGLKFPHCARCRRAWYCSQQCQKEAWKQGHKRICGKM